MDYPFYRAAKQRLAQLPDLGEPKEESYEVGWKEAMERKANQDQIPRRIVGLTTETNPSKGQDMVSMIARIEAMTEQLKESHRGSTSGASRKVNR